MATTAEGELRGSCRLLGFPELWAKSATTSGAAAVMSLNNTVNSIIRAHGCGSVIVSDEALSNYTEAGISCLRDPQLAPLVASAVKEKVWKSIDEEREELLNIFRGTFAPDAPRENQPKGVRREAAETIPVLVSAATRYQGHLHTLQMHFSRAEGSYSLPVDVRRLFNNFTQDESQIIRSYCESLHRAQLTRKAPPQDPSHPQKILFLATFTRLMELDKEKVLKVAGIASDDLTTARTIESLYFSWLIEAWMELKALAVVGGRRLQAYDAVVWQPLDRVRREWELRAGLLDHAISALLLVGECSADDSAFALKARTPKMLLSSVASLLYGLQPHVRFDPLGNSDADFTMLSGNGDDEEAAVRRIVNVSGREKPWRDIVACIQPTQLLRQESIEAERVVITQRHALNAFAPIVNHSHYNPMHSYHYYYDESLVRDHIPNDAELRAVVGMARRQCGAADSLHACIASFINSKPTHPFLSMLREESRFEEGCDRSVPLPCDTTMINPLHPPFEIDFEGILSAVIHDGLFDFGLLRYKNKSSMGEVQAVRQELRQALWAPIVPMAGREGDTVRPCPALLHAGPLLVRLLFWFIYCAFFNHKQVDCYNHYYMDLAGHAINTVVAYVTEKKIDSVMSFAVKSASDGGDRASATINPYRHHRGDSPSSIDFLPFAIVHATILAFFRTFPSNMEVFTEGNFVGPASLLLFELFLGRRGVPTTHYTSLRKRMFEHPNIRIIISKDGADADEMADSGPQLSEKEKLSDDGAVVDKVRPTSPPALTSGGTISTIGRKSVSDTGDFLKNIMHALNTHAKSMSPHRSRRGSPSTQSDLGLSPNDEALIGEVRRRISTVLETVARRKKKLLSAIAKKSEGFTMRGDVQEPANSAEVDEASLVRELREEVTRMIRLNITIASENYIRTATVNGSLGPGPITTSSGFTLMDRPSSRMATTPGSKRRATMYPKVRSLTEFEEELLSIARREMAIAANESVHLGSSSTPLSGGGFSHSVSPMRSRSTSVPTTPSRHGARSPSATPVTRPLGDDVPQALTVVLGRIVKQAVHTASVKAQKKEVDDANDIFVDEDFHIFNARLVADPEYAKEVLRDRRGSHKDIQGGGEKYVVGGDEGYGLHLPTSTIGRAQRLNALRDRINQTFDPSHVRSTKGVRSSTALSRLSLQLSQLSTRIASRREKVIKGSGVTGGASRSTWEVAVGMAGAGLGGSRVGAGAPVPRPSVFALARRPSSGQESDGGSIYDGASDGGASRPSSTCARTKRKTSSAIFSSSRKLSLFFNTDSNIVSGQPPSSGKSVLTEQQQQQHALVATEDDTMEGLEHELQSLMLPIAAVQCCPDAALAVQQLYKEGNGDAGGPSASRVLAIEPVRNSQLAIEESPMDAREGSKGTFADHIFGLAPQPAPGLTRISVPEQSLVRTGPPQLSTPSRKPDHIALLPHHQPFQKSGIYDLPSFQSGTIHTKPNKPFGLEKDAIDTMFARPKSVAHLPGARNHAMTPHLQSANSRVANLSAILPPRSSSSMAVLGGDAGMLPLGARPRRNSLDPSVDPSLEVPARAHAMPTRSSYIRPSSQLSDPFLPSFGTQRRVGTPSHMSRPMTMSSNQSAMSVSVGANKTILPTRGGGRFLSPPRVAAPTNAAIEEVNLRSCSPAISRSVPQNTRGSKIHMLAVTCQPTMPPPGTASRQAQLLRERNVERFKQEDAHREDMYQREMAGLRSTARTTNKAERELTKELEDPLRRTDFIDKWIAREPPKVSAVDPRDEVRVRQITKESSDPTGRSKLMWEGSRVAIEAKLNALELKEVIRGAERHITKSNRRKGGA